MEAVWDALWLTVTRRWFVLAFLVSFLVLAWRQLGPRRTAALLGIGYVVAWASEACSIRTGFPYGLYAYLWQPAEPTGLDPREPALAGVPVFDSISYVFIAYAALAMACWILGAGRERRSALGVWIAASVLFVMVDVVTDPVALRGERWFLGRIYHYPGGGVHHGVPLSNYGGWWLVGATILGLFAWIDRRLPAEPQRAGAGLGALFYLSIMAFCVGVAGWIGAWEVAVSGGLIAAPIAALALGRALLGQPRRG